MINPSGHSMRREAPAPFEQTRTAAAFTLASALLVPGFSAAASTPGSVEIGAITGQSIQHRTIRAYVIGSGSNVVLILAGIHGNEPSGTQLVRHFARWLEKDRRDPGNTRVIIVPAVNPDGLARHTRANGDGVDLNRNFPSLNWGSRQRRNGDNPGPSPASEPETKFILDLMDRFRPCRIVSVHAPYHEIDIDGPAMAIAREMRRFNHDRITRNMGYPTPGSLGTYAGRERHLPVVTLELGRQPASLIWKDNRRALLAAVDGPCALHSGVGG